MTIHLGGQRFGSGRLAAALLSACLLAVTSGPGAAASLSIGTPLATAPGYLPPLAPDTFLVPIEVSGAVGLQTWQFSLHFDNTVVEEVDPFDGSAGIYGARFTADPGSMSFVLGGFPLNGLGLVDTIAGFYPDLVDGVTGDGALVFVLFTRLPGQDGNDPGFVITGSDVGPTAVPEPAAWMLMAPGLALLGLTRRRAGQPGERRRPVVGRPT